MSEMRIANCCLLLLLAALAALPGCRQVMKEAFKPPRVEVLDVALDSDPTRTGRSPWRFVVTLAVDNPNPYPLHVVRLGYSGMIGSEVVAEGERSDPVRIDPSGRTVVRAPVALNPGAFEAAARQVVARKAVSWEFNGSASLKTPVMGVVRIPFSKTGTYDLLYILKRMGIGLD